MFCLCVYTIILMFLVKTLGATQSAQQLKEDLSWFEKDIEDFDVTLDKEKGEFEAEGMIIFGGVCFLFFFLFLVNVLLCFYS